MTDSLNVTVVENLISIWYAVELQSDFYCSKILLSAEFAPFYDMNFYCSS